MKWITDSKIAIVGLGLMGGSLAKAISFGTDPSSKCDNLSFICDLSLLLTFQLFRMQISDNYLLPRR